MRLSLLILLGLATAPNASVTVGVPPTKGSTKLALKAAKIVTCSWDGPQIIDNGIVLIEDGLIRSVGPARGLDLPPGFEMVDLGDRWLTPGMIGLHCHGAGYSLYAQINDLNDTVYLANPGLRASTAAKPANFSMKMAAAGGVTSVLYIPGSGSNIGGAGVLLKTGFEHYEENLIRDPGSMKLAQWGNPESWTIGVGMTVEHWNTRNTIRRGLAYARRWEEFEKNGGVEPVRNPQFDIFRELLAKRTQIATHTQMYQVVLMTLTMIRGEFGLDVYLDHSSVGGWMTGAMAKEMGVPAIVGPRSVDPFTRGMMNWSRNRVEGMRGLAAGYQEAGMKMIGFNTDAPVIPQEQLSVNAAMAGRYGMKDNMGAVVRGLTIVPARAAGIDDMVGSIEAGKHADILVTTGHPADPRTSMERVYIQGRVVYDAVEGRRRW